jgi:hypothetical protein
MSKRLFVCLIAVVCFTFISITTFAAPKTMPDGGTFDAEFYAANNPDVVAVFGTDEAALYNHYLQYGKAEGRLPYASATTPAPAKTSSAGNCSKQTILDISGLVYNAHNIEEKPNKLLAKFQSGTVAVRYAACTTAAPALVSAKALYSQAATLCGDYDNLQVTKTYLTQMAASIPDSAPTYDVESVSTYYSNITAYLLLEKPLYEELTRVLSEYN